MPIYGITTLEKLKIILNQYGGPIHLSYQTISVSLITSDLAEYHRENIHRFTDYTLSELYALHALVDYAIKNLGEGEFSTVTGLDLYKDGYVLLNQIRNRLIGKV